MRRVQFDRYGDAGEMYIGEYELPQPKRDQVRVRVRAAGINPLDWKQRQGDVSFLMGGRFPKGMGSDFAGVVEAVGEDVRNLQAGDEVFGTMHFLRPGALAEVVVTDSSRVAKKPSRLSFVEAACLPIPATVAWAALVHRARVSSQSRVFVNGCTGAVGSIAVQLAVARGARVGGACNAASIGDARSAGVDPVFDCQDQTFWNGAEAFDTIFDTAGTLGVGFGLSRLRPRGTFVDINPTLRRVMRGMLSWRYKVAFAAMSTNRLPDIAELAAQGKLRPSIRSEVKLSNAVAAIAALEKGPRPPGRVVVVFPE